MNSNDFLTHAWHWGDQNKANELLDRLPKLPESDFLAACVCGRADSVKRMLAEDGSLATTKSGPRDWEPILYATWSCFLKQRESDFVQVVQLLLEHGADPNSSWKNPNYDAEESALYGCVEVDCLPVARVLLAAGAKPSDGESLYHACEKWNLELLKALGEAGLDHDDVSYCLKHALDMRWEASLDWFLEQGADPNAVHPAANETTLHWAVKRGCSVDAIRKLIAAGADPNAKTKTGQSAYIGLKGASPLDYALRTGQLAVAESLKQSGAIASPAQPVDEFVYAAAAGDEQARTMLNADPTLLSQLDNNDRNLLAHCAQMQSWAGVRLMAELGWPIEATGWMGAKPLTWALCFGHLPTVETLLGKSANLDGYGNYFRNALHTVLHCRWETGDQLEAFQSLLERGMSVPDNYFPCGQEKYDQAYLDWQNRT